MIIRLAKLRKERSAEAARARRNKENGEYDNIKKLLPIDESKFTGPSGDVLIFSTSGRCFF